MIHQLFVDGAYNEVSNDKIWLSLSDCLCGDDLNKRFLNI